MKTLLLLLFLCMTVAAAGEMPISTAPGQTPPVQHVRKLTSTASGVIAGLWTEAVPNPRLVVGRFSPLGQPLDGPGLRLHDNGFDQDGSAMATDGKVLFVVWEEGVTSLHPGAVYEAIVSVEGSLSVQVHQLASDAGLSNLAVAWDGSAITVAYQRFSTSAIVAIRTDRDGNALDPAPRRRRGLGRRPIPGKMAPGFPSLSDG